MKNKITICSLIIISLFIISLVSAGDVTEINYELQLKYTPYCSNVCSSELTTNVTTNQTTNHTTCNNNCYYVFDIRGLPTDKHSIVPSLINTSSETFKDKEGQWISLYGIYSAELGNLTDITGINEKLKDLNATTVNLQKCQTTLLEYNTNLTRCNDITGGNSNYSISECNVDKGTLENNINSKNEEISKLNDELQKQKNNQTLLIIAAFVAGILAIKYGLPFLKDKNIKSDPLNKNRALSSEY